MANNPFDEVNGASTPPAASAPSNPFDAVVSQFAPKQAQDAKPVSTNPFDQATTGNTLPKAESDPNTPWYTKAWDWANTPLWNLNSQNTSGWTGGLEDVASGLTSPVSLGLAIGTLGGGALLEGLGLTAEEIPVAVRGMKSLVDAGFTAQNAYQAVRESPRVLDAIKDGDYDTAKRLAVSTLAGGGFAVLGGKQLMKDAGAYVDKAAVAGGFKVKPSAENLKIRENGGIYQRDVESNGKASELLAEDWRKQFKDIGATDREATMYLMQAGLNKNKLIARYNMLADSAGRPETKINVSPENEQVKLETDSLGVRWAVSPEGVRVSIPKSVPDTDVNSYASQKLSEQAAAQKDIKQGKLYYHGSNSPAVSSADVLDSTKYGKMGLTGVGTYLTDSPEVASTPGYGGGENGRVLGSKLSPNANILESNSRLPEDLNNQLMEHFKDLAKKLYPGHNTDEIVGEFFDFPPEGKTSTYQAFIDSLRRMIENNANPVVSTEEDGKNLFMDLQKRVEAAGYDGVRYEGGKLVGGAGTHEAVMVFPGREKSVLTPDVPRKIFPTATEEDAHNSPQLPHSDSTDAEKQARYDELVKQQLVKKLYTEKEIDGMLGAYKSAISATPDMNELAKQTKDHLSDWLVKAQDKGVVRRAVEDYITQIWQPKDLDNPAANKLMNEAKSGFHTDVSMARQRTFENAFEGQLLGRKLAETDPITLAANYQNKVGEAIAGRDFMERLQDYNVRASDGRPITALSGTGQMIEQKNPATGKYDTATLVNPKNIRNPLINPTVADALEKSGQLDKFLQEGKVIKFDADDPAKNKYMWNVHDYQDVDHAAFHDWKFATHDSNGKPVYVKGELRVHPDAYEYLNRFIGGEKSVLQQAKPIAAALKVGSEAKHLILSLSPFHIAQEGLRALMTGISPFGMERWDLRNDPTLSLGVEESLTLGKDRRGLQDFQEGNVASGQSSIIKRVPVVRDIQNALQTFLFDKYIPNLKVRGFKALYERYAGDLDSPEALQKLQDKRPDLQGYDKSRAAARLAAEDTNERFGGLNYKQLGRSAGTQDFLRLATLAPDWMESEIRFLKRTMSNGAEGGVARQDFVRMAAGLWGAARVLNYITSGKFHNEAPFGVAVQGSDGKEKIYSLRTLPTDILHMTSDPIDFLRGRISPLGRIGTEVYSGRDYAGRKETPYETLVDVTRNSLPIPVQSITQAIQGKSPDITNVDQAVKALGATATVYRTDAEKKAIELASNRTESGPVDQDQLLRHQAITEFEDQIRAGKMSSSDVYQLAETGHLTVKEAKQIVKQAQDTKGMDPELARLYSRSSKLPMKDFMSVYDSGTADEKASLSKLLIKKKNTYLKSAMKDMTPTQRQNDPTYIRLRRMFAQEAPWGGQ